MTMVMLSFAMLFGFFLLRRRENKHRNVSDPVQTHLTASSL
ncbi:hypothetical protein [Lolliginicoccus suaedae]|nr:hypothetical protein [Lolliginicoccus suaedae]